MHKETYSLVVVTAPRTPLPMWSRDRILYANSFLNNPPDLNDVSPKPDDVTSSLDL